MLRAVQGAGSLVPEDIRWLSATSGGRIERIRVRPGVKVTADTILVDIANPDVELAALEAERQVAGAAADLANLRAKSDNERLASRPSSRVRAPISTRPQRRADADSSLAKRGFLSELEMARSRDQAKTLDGKLDIERQRLQRRRAASTRKIDAQDAQLGRLRAIADFRRKSVEQLHGARRPRRRLAGAAAAGGADGGAGRARRQGEADPTRLKGRSAHRRGRRAKEVRVGQSAIIDTRNGTVAGLVSRVEPAVTAGTVKVEVTPSAAVAGRRAARPDDRGHHRARAQSRTRCSWRARRSPSRAPPCSCGRLVGEDAAVRVPVTLGRMSVRTIEVQQGPGRRRPHHRLRHVAMGQPGAPTAALNSTNAIYAPKDRGEHERDTDQAGETSPGLRDR